MRTLWCSSFWVGTTSLKTHTDKHPQNAIWSVDLAVSVYESSSPSPSPSPSLPLPLPLSASSSCCICLHGFPYRDASVCVGLGSLSASVCACVCGLPLCVWAVGCGFKLCLCSRVGLCLHVRLPLRKRLGECFDFPLSLALSPLRSPSLGFLLDRSPPPCPTLLISSSPAPLVSPSHSLPVSPPRPSPCSPATS
jgi:hypothetical protein